MARLYPTMSQALIDNEDLSFGYYFQELVDAMLTPEVHQRLCEERYNALMEDMKAPIFVISSDMKKAGLWTERRWSADKAFASAIAHFSSPTRINKSTFKSFILCYAAVGVIPVSQPVLGECVERFLQECGGWETKRSKYKDALAFRLPGSFGTGKRQ